MNDERRGEGCKDEEEEKSSRRRAKEEFWRAEGISFLESGKVSFAREESEGSTGERMGIRGATVILQTERAQVNECRGKANVKTTTHRWMDELERERKRKKKTEKRGRQALYY